jgi:hypothetical protein
MYPARVGIATDLISCASALRYELSARNRAYARRLALEHRQTRGQPPAICYVPGPDGHGNFVPQSYRAILKNPAWRRRLQKPHTSAYEALPREGINWRELDSSTSSDALLMNVFCYPGILDSKPLENLLGVEETTVPEFGVKARVPLADGRLDRTEIDMRLGDLLVEAKLTETNFQQKSKSVVEGYRDFDEVFDATFLPQTEAVYLSYQLIRNVLAAFAMNCSFCVILDERRPDLREQWFAVMRAIRVHDLKPRCKVLTWQELAEFLPMKLQNFLDEKYGIVSIQRTEISNRTTADD